MLKSFAGGRVFGAAWGTGPASVLALHGWRRTHLDFGGVFDRQHTQGVPAAVAPDLFGFGATPAPPVAWGSSEYAQQLVALFDEPGVLGDRVVLVGHSFGGRVAVRLWDLVPDRVERVVLSGVPLLDREGRRTRPAARFRIGRRLHRMGLVSEARMEALRHRYGSPDYRAAEGVMRGVFVRVLAESYAEDMATITSPVDLLWGARDTEVPLEVAERARPLFPSATLHRLDGIGHLVPTEAPDALLAAVLGHPVGGAVSVPALLATAGPSRLHGGLAWVTVAACALACGPAGVRWLRVAQREHYLPGSVSRFALRWWRLPPVNPILAAVAIAAAAVSWWWPVAGVITAAAVAVGPYGLSLRGRTAPLAWTRRLRTLAAVAAGVAVIVLVAGALTGPASVVAVVVVLALPALVDLSCLVTAPVELKLGGHFVDAAAARLARVDPLVVAVTGSYGKTSTKGHIAHLVRPTRSVVVSPASFNNRAGLARAVNEHLADGTEVFVAEMGTYGPGEIAALCRWCTPDISVITAIGPVHLERFGSEDRIVEAKTEILASAQDIVLPVDDPRLAAVADRMAGEGRRVLRCSATDRGADVCVLRGDGVDRITAFVDGELLVADVLVASGVHPSNLACAVAVALLCKVDPADIAVRLADLPAVEHRLQAVPAGSGATILDDTYNSNPSGAAEALAVLAALAVGDAGAGEESGAPRRELGGGRRVVVTPGMVELGDRQESENRRFGEAIARVATDVLVVGRTNRRALLAGLAAVPGSTTGVHLVVNRDEAVGWVRAHLCPPDVVLYENDLPDHYP